MVVFRNRKRAGIDRDAYDAQAEAMEAMARAQPGFLSFNGFVADDGGGVAISEWESAEAARAWGRVAEQRAAKADGRARWYGEYTLMMADDPAVHRFVARDET